MQNIFSVSIAGGFWCFTNNIFSLVSSNLINFKSQGSDGGLFYLSINNTISLIGCQGQDFNAEEFGGMAYIEVGNIIKVSNCVLSNLTAMMNGILIFAKYQNIMTFIDNNLEFYYYVGLFYFNSENQLVMQSNNATIAYPLYNSMLFYCNFSNSLIINN